jgi:methylmalonyl-CoA mutase N-terminal domain/subunit
MTINAPAAVLLLLYQLVAGTRGAASGCPHDPERRAQGVHRPGHHIYPPKASLRLVGDVFGYCR